ncbi:unnamed protein product [Linum tenue]|uniref:Uncharacterized protein n=1 Tax=Linum tenue TaxID=586396 RepID=A0AAV0PEH7_9ROSI|nr:unnamed protein product [Linum tenue]
MGHGEGTLYRGLWLCKICDLCFPRGYRRHMDAHYQQVATDTSNKAEKPAAGAGKSTTGFGVSFASTSNLKAGTEQAPGKYSFLCR